MAVGRSTLQELIFVEARVHETWQLSCCLGTNSLKEELQRPLGRCLRSLHCHSGLVVAWVGPVPAVRNAERAAPDGVASLRRHRKRTECRAVSIEEYIVYG
ncbi:hypothetical protein NDU88_003954 [Pleurodeles waltl]|uniref:Uncharacterized protein n=1 Tax=Pleurodeles waltl TaxID=8319 RepID=A0AAV7MS86_PLEWA|nr:hypothetical protein NDU88_003954 [Pleurodeles waltl]